MEIVINGKPHTLDKSISIHQLIGHLDLADKRFAIEVNEELVPRSTFNNHLLNEGDKIEIVGAIGGG